MGCRGNLGMLWSWWPWGLVCKVVLYKPGTASPGGRGPGGSSEQRALKGGA